MPDDLDHYEAYYADKLWNLLPAVYRSEDSAALGANGPLRELVNRIGAQAAILRRSIDRLWEDQSIETCDDWVIPYIADLLATRLVASLDARGQRLDVANTIYYRRRRGTVAILEQIASDITGWDGRIVEFFRRLGRTRHGLDPELGLPAQSDDPAGARALQFAEGLTGMWTHTAIGGWADLRSVYGASKVQSAFDEYFHTADFRLGRGQIGWHNIPRLGVFLWRLKSFGVDYTTPVAVKNCPGYFTFDPTGRQIPLFARSARAFGDAWVSPQEWQLPVPISTPLLHSALSDPGSEPLYAAIDPADGTTLQDNSLGIFTKPGVFYQLVSGSQVTTNPEVAPPHVIMIFPECGEFQALHPPLDGPPFVKYHYGFPSAIGAGPYDRSAARREATPTPVPVQAVPAVGPLDAALTATGATGTVRIDDSLTYTAVKDLSGISAVTILARNGGRPVIRLAGGAKWTFTGAAGGTLVLEGLFVTGCDIVLAGEFDSVTLTCCTLDPGSLDAKTGKIATAVDGQDLAPCHLSITAKIRQLTIDRCLLGPIATSAAGAVENLAINDSIVQALQADKAIDLSSGSVSLTRCTLLGPGHMHRLYASDCILGDVASVENAQDGCVRFSAWSTGSTLPRKYESVEIAPKSPLFASRTFGQPAYAQLIQAVDRQIVSGAVGASISQGAEDGSEMGSYALEKGPIKERSLAIKYEEFMPLGLVPVIVYVT
ncbi:MAG: hypothetical protein LAN70_07365 [Acidobacteriia bacterium]|nr:hypothetical protein [Terriglobia bacterium]